jgi:hypothetical protein
MAKQEKQAAAPREKEKIDFALGKLNFILMGCCLALIVIGFALMTGSANDDPTRFNDAIFESRRTVVGPAIALLGFVLMAPAIIIRKKNRNDK